MQEMQLRKQQKRIIVSALISININLNIIMLITIFSNSTTRQKHHDFGMSAVLFPFLFNKKRTLLGLQYAWIKMEYAQERSTIDH